jgi:hypothetical protein
VKVVALVLAALFAGGNAVIAASRARLEARIDALTHGRRLLVPPDSVIKINLVDIGVTSLRTTGSPRMRKLHTSRSLTAMARAI